MAQPTRIHFVRHGAVENPGDVFYGRLSGFPLSEEGRRQAQAAAEVLRGKPLTAIFSSPQQRARETAVIIAALHCGLSVQVSQLLNEIHTCYDGLPFREVAERKWDVYAGNEPPHEQPKDVLARVQQFIAEVRQRHVGQQVAAITHGDLIVFLLLWIKGLPATTDNRSLMYRHYADKASITTLSYDTAALDQVPAVQYTVPHRG
jgi:broad specificity phosphatase PhoE